MRILKFKSQLTIAFFAAVKQLNGPLRKQNFNGFKRSWFVICGFRSVLCVSVFQGSLLVIVIMIDGREKRNCECSFWILDFACLWEAQYSNAVSHYRTKVDILPTTPLYPGLAYTALVISLESLVKPTLLVRETCASRLLQSDIKIR